MWPRRALQRKFQNFGKDELSRLWRPVQGFPAGLEWGQGSLARDGAGLGSADLMGTQQLLLTGGSLEVSETESMYLECFVLF